MKGEAPWVCDNCGKRRDVDTNHWFVIAEDNEDNPGFCLRIAKWNEDFATLRSARHACGSECRNVLVERWFSLGRFEKNELPDAEKVTA